MLIDYISNILTNNGYVQCLSDVTLEGYKFYVFETVDRSSKEEYFVVLESLVQTELSLALIFNEKADQLFDELSAQKNMADYFQKNSTLIICCEETACPVGLALSIEEDHYNFKKNVISYVAAEIDSIADKVKSEDGVLKLTNEYINNIINEGGGDLFRAFKSSGGASRNYYSLLMKIVSKLPLINYIPPVKSLHDLEGAISTSMTKQQVAMYESSISEELLNSDKKFDVWLDQP
ncbi:ABC-three component system middle component 1 [Janthinobacterium sp. PSPC2-1]|uniref:ABC-three component system middle component 1 n=1 Tax=unclassified Janthinobacterium TaxID=2610881 RepID=UPI003CFAA732